MLPIVISIGLLVALLVFALVGFIQTVSWLFGSLTQESKTSNASRALGDPGKANLADDLVAARRVIQHFRSRQEVSEETFESVRDFLDQKICGQVTEPPAALSVKATASEPEPAISNQVATETNPDSPGRSADSDDEIKKGPLAPDDRDSDRAAAGIVNTETKVPEGRIVEAELVEELSSGPRLPAPAPWDLPDPPARPPRRTFAELMSGFMEEKNMRWGELTSGILIVLSAVGLVVSLREELSNTIPYFSALLFMLITAAIQGAGIYTLKKWKLRNTSRGTLVIGLLLVPLNFAAACVLSSGEERRALNDPWLWAAVLLGIGGFSALTWWSSKHLLRRGQWPMVVAIMGCCLGTLLVNRMAETATSGFSLMLLGMPIAISFLVGTCLFERRQWVRQRWSERGVHRIYLHLGISSFAAISALAMVVFRSETASIGCVSVAPIASVVFLMTSWLGTVVRKGVTGATANTHRITGRALEIFGLILVAISLVGSFGMPLVLIVNAIVICIGVAAMSCHQKNARMLPVAWVVLAIGLLTGTNLMLGQLAVEGWSTLAHWQSAILSGQSGLCLLLTGIGVVGTHLGMRRYMGRWLAAAEGQQSIMGQPMRLDSVDGQALDRGGWLAGGAIALAGCLIALIASLIDRGNLFDVVTANGLLSLAAIGTVTAIVWNARSGRRLERRADDAILAHCTSVVLLAALLHGLIWNRWVGEWIDTITGEVGIAWAVVASLHGLVLAVLAWIVSLRASDAADSDSAVVSGNMLSIWSGIGVAAVSLGAILLVRLHSGWATLFLLIASLACWFLGLARSRLQRSDGKDAISAPFVFSTGWLLAVAIADLGVGQTWCPGMESPVHWMIQLIGLAGWSIGWSVVSVGFNRSKNWRWMASPAWGVEEIVLGGLVIVAAGLVGIPLVAGVGQELSGDFDSAAFYSIGDSIGWAYSGLGAVGLAILVSIIVRPNWIKGMGAILIWMMAWALAALPFSESLSVGSALRWSLPIGGVVLALGLAVRRPWIPVWVAGRNGLQLSGPSTWKRKSTQDLIQFALAFVSSVVLLITTLAASQALINGVGSLGGPTAGSWFKWITPELSFGGPIALIVATFLMYSISERRRWLAMSGSFVFQYIVVMAIVLLFASGGSKLASPWFLNILQVVSLGMTGYGFVWHWMRGRIDGGKAPGGSKQFQNANDNQFLLGPIELHVLINGLLITSLAGLVMGRFYVVPDQPGGWIGAVGSGMGLLAWGAFSVLAVVVGWKRLSTLGSISTRLWLIGWLSLSLIGLVAAVLDRGVGFPRTHVPWLSFNVLTAGILIVAAVETFLVFVWVGRRSQQDLVSGLADGLGRARWPVLLLVGLGMLFAVRGVATNPESFWLYECCLVGAVVLVAIVGALLRSSLLGWLSIGVASVCVTALRWKDPLDWFTGTQPYGLNMMTVVASFIAISWTGYYLVLRRGRGEPIKRSFVGMPNGVLLVGAMWMFAAAVMQLPADSGGVGRFSTLANPLGGAAMASLLGLWVVSICNDRGRFRVVTFCLLTLAVGIGASSWMANSDSLRWAGVSLCAAMIVGGWGWLWLNRRQWRGIAKTWGATRLAALEKSARRQLPVYCLIVALMTCWSATLSILFMEGRTERYIAAAVPLALAVSFACQSNVDRRRWMQQLSLALLTLGGLFVAWADLLPDQMQSDNVLHPLVRSLIVLAGAMSVYGGLVTRWVRSGDGWLQTLRELAVVTCGLAIGCLALVIVGEATSFDKATGCGLALGEGIAVAVLVAGMIVGLIVIATRPENDPFSLSLQGRMGYVHAAQFTVAALVAHLYFSMPWLFRFGIAEYWPYIAMAICFGGVGIARILEKRKLTVLAQPLFQSAAVLPLVVAAGVFSIGSEADVSLVILTVGMIYLMISFVHRSMLSGIGAIVFGNLALWILFQRMPEFAFLEHPQLWVIPPAVSVLIAGQLSRNTMAPSQLASLRYICVAIIYVGSTSEIFIDGVGNRLWPPMVLASLAVTGILTGILLQIKSFLYFGCLFLLMAMATMVAHAQQSLDHVWPWWAFGIGLGVSILVLFGVFEKRKKEMKRIASRLKAWKN